MPFTEEEKAILSKYVTSTDDNVFAVRNMPGLAGAAYARYSRAKGGFRETLLKEFISEGIVDAQHAEELIARVLVAFGDDSVGELEGTHISFEKISMLATKELEDHRIGGSPIEQSTRYVFYDQKDEAGNWLYYKGSELAADPDFGKLYSETNDFIFQTYADLVEPMKDYFSKLKPIEEAEYDINGDGAKEKLADLSDEKEIKSFKQTYTFDLRSKACDVLRCLLPLSTFTNVGMFGNGRFFQTVISHLISQDLPEFTTTGEKAFAAASQVIPQYVRRAKRSEYDANSRKNMFAFAAKILAGQKEELADSKLPSYVLLSKGENFISGYLSKNGTGAEAISPASIAAAMQTVRDATEISAMLYPYSKLSWETLREIVLDMTLEEKAAVVSAYLGSRGNRRERPSRALESGYEYEFDLVTDWGVYKDLMRHRMNTQQRQLFSADLGFNLPPEAKAAGVETQMKACVEKAKALHQAIAAKDQVLAQYAVLHGNFVRWSISMSDKEAMHMLELRTTPQGHPNYRKASQAMHTLISERSKWRADMMSYVDYNDYYWSRADSEAKQRVQEKKLDEKFHSEK
jgi:thymidylate synthase ThyX